MASLIPNRSSCLPRMTPGERRFAHRLEDKLDDGYLCWYDVPVGPQYRHPDFMVMDPNRGILILEVKDWKLDTIVDLDRDSATLHTERGRAIVPNPLRQARDYAIEVVKVLQKDPALIHPPGSLHQGKLVSPWGFGVVLTNITRADFRSASLDHFISASHVICRDEMTESADPEQFQARLWQMFTMPFPCVLSLPQIDRVRWHLFPQIRIQAQGSLLDAPTSKPVEATIPDMIRVMDLQQEQLARSMGDGHRVIHGVAGSGKTMILGYRCVELARRHSKPILVLCYNKTLAARLEQLMHVNGISERVTVAHFHGWCSAQLKTYSVRGPGFCSDFEAYSSALVQTIVDNVEHGTIPRGQYAAVLIDEGHDFAPEWLQLVAQMVDPDTNALLLLYDDAQTIYGHEKKRKFSFASVGIQAQGRTTILRLNYRNTYEILATAKAFAEELLTATEADDDHIPVIAPESAGRRGPLPELMRCRNIWDEIDHIRSGCEHAIANGASPDDLAVICRSGRQAKLIAEKLQQSGLPTLLADSAHKRQLFAGPPAIKILTMHSSKGLEFNTVFVPGICEIGQRITDDIALRQEARLLYVAMTRTLGRLVMLHHRDSVMTDKISAALSDVGGAIAA